MQELRQFAMSISGSVIFGSSGEVQITPISSMASRQNNGNAMMSGGSSAKVYVFTITRINACRPSITRDDFPADKSLIKMVQDMLTSIGEQGITDLRR